MQSLSGFLHCCNVAASSWRVCVRFERNPGEVQVRAGLFEVWQPEETAMRAQATTLRTFLVVPMALCAAAALAHVGNLDGRMTGGGSFFCKGVRVTHGFTLHCKEGERPNRLQINFSGGNNFHLTELTDVNCLDNPALDPSPPDVRFDTLVATGVGTYNKEPATIEIAFTDAGEPGGTVGTFPHDVAAFKITLVGETTPVFSCGNTQTDPPSGPPLRQGNHQAHPAIVKP